MNLQQQQQSLSVPNKLGYARAETQKILKPSHGSGTWIASFHAPLSRARSLVITQSSRSLFTDSSQVKFGLPRPLLTLSARLNRPICSGASEGLHWICPNHLRRCWTSFSSICATPTLSRITSFRIRSFLVWPHAHLNMRISATPSCWRCHLLVDQHSAP